MRKLALAARCGIAALVYGSLVRGDLTLDTGWGRTLRPLGPLEFEFPAPRETVFDLIAAPYSIRAPRAFAEKVQVIERGTDMVLAAHRTPVRRGLEAVTLETVRFERPHKINFRLVRGPVPHVTESFELQEQGRRAKLVYRGEMGADFWAIGRWWCDMVAQKWEAAVKTSLESVREETERLHR